MTNEDQPLLNKQALRDGKAIAALVSSVGLGINMNNPHIVVGEPRRCVCGSYDGKAIGCADVIRVLNRLEDYAQTQINPSLFIRKGDRNPPQPPTGEDIMLLVTVMKPLLTECD